MFLVIRVMKDICNNQMSLKKLGGGDSKINANTSFKFHFQK